MLSIKINLVIGEAVQPVSILISNINKVEVVLKRAILEFNQCFSSENALFRLVNDHTLYGLKPSKKTGFPKSEMPSKEKII